MNPFMELRHGLMRAARIRLMSMGRKPTKQAARALVDQHFSRLRARIKEETRYGGNAAEGATHGEGN